MVRKYNWAIIVVTGIGVKENKDKEYDDNWKIVGGEVVYIRSKKLSALKPCGTWKLILFDFKITWKDS